MVSRRMDACLRRNDKLCRLAAFRCFVGYVTRYYRWAV